MYRMVIELDETSYLEAASRITGRGEDLLLSFRGLKEKGEPSIAAVSLNKKEVKELIEVLEGWINQEQT